MTTVTQLFFIILSGGVMIPYFHDVKVGGYALDFLKPTISGQFF